MSHPREPFTRYAGVTIDMTSLTVGEFVVIGVPPRDHAPGALPTTIGRRALIRSHTVIYAGSTIGDDFETGHGVLIRESNQIGDRVIVGSHSVIEHHVVLGDGVRLHSNVFVPEFSVLDSGCAIGPGTVLTNARYPYSRGVKSALRGPHVGAGAVVGANVTLLPGVRIGAGALVGAGAVVVKDVPPGAVAVGNPARVVRSVDEIAAYRAAQGEGEEVS
jgi:acetyltransferase-like isoleucine patch superfamily enzyme